jgi:hypothetical protein
MPTSRDCTTSCKTRCATIGDMKPIIIVLALSLSSPVLQAADGDSVDTMVRAVYDVISGPAGTRDWARFRLLFADGARMIPVRNTPEGPTPAVITPEDYVTRAGATFEKSAFYESEVARRVETFGSIAHVFSTYESRHAPGEKPFARGINSIQLVKIGKSWKVITILWDAEREGNPLPAKYLSATAQQ